MSSILDALNKLEQDRAHAQRSSEGEDVDPAAAAQELIAPSVLRDRITVRFSPLTLILGGLACALILISFSVAAALLLVRSSEPDAAIVADVVAQGTTVPPYGARVVDETVAVAARSEKPLPEKAPSSAVAAKTETPEPSAVEVPEEQPDAVAGVAASMEAPEPARVPPETIPPPPEEGTSPVETHMAKAEVTTPIKDVTAALGAAQRLGVVAPQERTSDARPPVPDIRSRVKRETVVPRAEPESPALSLKELPFLTQADRARYTEGKLMVNMVKPASETNPYGYAVINASKVYEGQNIRGTQFRLIGVEMGGIGVNVQGTTKRFFIPW